jgi:chromate transporter
VPELAQLATLFLRLGATAFGGPAAHVAIMEEEVVRRRAWLTHDEFLDLLGATNLIPGPNSTEMAMHIGRQRAGAAGLIVAGASFILPAALATYALAWAYVRFGALPPVQHILYGIKPVMIAVVLQALWVLGRSAMKSRGLAALAVAAALAAVLGAHELAILFGAGLVAAGYRLAARRESPPHALFVPLALAAVAPPAAGLLPIFTLFLKIGSVLFGSGYVLLAFLRADLVDRLHWLTERQLLDAIAAGQLTPGPLFSTATFVGYLLRGGPGAALATLGIFLPAFIFVALSGPLIPRLRRSPVAGAFLDGVNVASLSLMAFVTWQLGRAALVDVPTVALAVVSAVVLLRFKVSSLWLILAGAAVGVWVGLLR